jgi:hypothetical protein
MASHELKTGLRSKVRSPDRAQGVELVAFSSAPTQPDFPALERHEARITPRTWASRSRKVDGSPVPGLALYRLGVRSQSKSRLSLAGQRTCNAASSAFRRSNFS